MRIHRMAVQQESLSGRGDERYEPLPPNQLYLLPNVSHGFVLPELS